MHPSTANSGYGSFYGDLNNSNYLEIMVGSWTVTYLPEIG